MKEEEEEEEEEVSLALLLYVKRIAGRDGTLYTWNLSACYKKIK